MILRIAQKEMTEVWRDGRFRLAGAVVLVLLAGALLLGWRQYRDLRAQHELAQQATRQQWLQQGKKNPHSAAHYGVYAFKPKVSLSLVDRGTDPYTGSAVWLEAHKMNEFKYRPAQDATAVQRFGELTGATVLQLLIPLLIVLLSFNAFAGERELGTLRQLMSLGVRPSTLAAGKALGLAGALGLLLVPAALIGSAAILLGSDAGDASASLPRLAGMTTSYLLYFAAFLGISLAVSAWAKTSRAALLTLLAFWMFNGLIAPRAASDVAKALHPTPSAFAFAQGIENAMNEPDGSRDQQLIAGLLKKYNVDKVEALPVNLAGIRLQDGEEHGNAIYDKAFGQLWATYAQQDRVHQWFGLAAPALAVRSASMGFAGTDFSQHAHFAQAAEAYRRRIQRTMNTDIATNASKAGPYLAEAALWAKVPSFQYQAPGAGWVLGQQTRGLGILTLWCLAAAALAVWATRRVEVL